MPAVSVIMNVFNGAATLRDAMQSVLAQSYSDWEIIVWDDQSTDESAAMAQFFGDARIRYFLSPQKTPLGAARQAAIRQASGDWLAFLDQDDLWEPKKLELQMALTRPDAVGLVYGRTLAVYPSGRLRDLDYFHEFEPLPEGKLLPELLGRGCFVAMSSALLRRSAVNSVPPIPDEVRTTPDYFLYLNVCEKYEARAVQSVICRYRVQPHGMHSVYRRELLAETLHLLERWRHRVPAETYQRRHRQISTTLAVEEVRTPGQRMSGWRRLRLQGSFLWLLSRPFAHLGRWLRREIKTPWWKRPDS